jgi:hypothetical protein
VTEKNIRQEALQMSRDLTALVDQQQAADDRRSGGVSDTAVRDYVQALLRQYRADDEVRQERIRALEAEGRRIVGGGQTGQDTWEVTDWRTGDLLARGTGDHHHYDYAADRLDPDGKWIHIDNIDTDPGDVEPIGIPDSLAGALQDWLGSAGTPDEDVAELVGWNVEAVARHRQED